MKLHWLTFDWSSRPQMFCKMSILRNFAKFTRNHLYQSQLLFGPTRVEPFYALQKRSLREVSQDIFSSTIAKSIKTNTPVVWHETTKNFSMIKFLLMFCFLLTFAKIRKFLTFYDCSELHKFPAQQRSILRKFPAHCM